jgi:hypothetical protein
VYLFGLNRAAVNIENRFDNYQTKIKLYAAPKLDHTIFDEFTCGMVARAGKRFPFALFTLPKFERLNSCRITKV